jgi:hypothetical protein
VRASVVAIGWRSEEGHFCRDEESVDRDEE